MVYQPTPENGKRAEELLFEALSRLKRRHRKDASRVGLAVVQSVMLRTAYLDALGKGDEDWAKTLAVVCTGFLDSYCMQSELASTVVLSSLLDPVQSPIGDIWCKAILGVLREAGRIPADI